MTLGPARRFAVPAAVVLVVLVLRPGVVRNALLSPVAWAVAAGVGLLALGVRAGLRRCGAAERTARLSSSGVVALCLVLLLAPSFQQRTLVEPLPESAAAGLSAPLEAAGPAAAPTSTPTASPAPSPALSPTPAPRVAEPSPRPTAPARSRLAPVPRMPPAGRSTPAPVTAPQARPVPVAPSASPRSTAPARPRVASPQAAATSDRRGRLAGIGHRARGTVVLRTVDGQGYALLQDIDVEGTVGPSVHLVPAGQRDPGGGPRLGALKAEKGTFSYRLPAGTDLSQSWTLLIWCDPYDTPIAAADPV